MGIGDLLGTLGIWWNLSKPEPKPAPFILPIDRFPVCLPFVLAQECPQPNIWSSLRNFSDDSHDPGGKTMCGITQREYDAFRKHKGEAVQDVRQISQDEGEEIYQDNYWMPQCPRLPPGLDLCLFDEAVNAGPFEAIKILQQALGIRADGIWGAETDMAVRGIFNLPVIIANFTRARLAYYQSLPGYTYFGNGWTSRTRAIGTQALRMTTASL